MASNQALPNHQSADLIEVVIPRHSSLGRIRSGRIRSGRTFLSCTRGADRQTRPISQVLGAARLGTVPADRAGQPPVTWRCDVIILGLILLVIGFVIGVPALWTIGLILVVIGAILFLLGAIGREVGGRRYWY